jgi:hypothetical protein
MYNTWLHQLTVAPDQHCVCLWVVLDGLAQAVCQLTLPGCVLNDGHNAVAIEAMALNALQTHDTHKAHAAWVTCRAFVQSFMRLLLPQIAGALLGCYPAAGHSQLCSAITECPHRIKSVTYSIIAAAVRLSAPSAATQPQPLLLHCMLRHTSVLAAAERAAGTAVAHLDHLEVCDFELAGLWVQHGGHDCMQGVAVHHSTSTTQLICLQHVDTWSVISDDVQHVLKFAL